MRRNRRVYNYKFTERTHSVRGITGCVLAILSILAGAALTALSYGDGGNGTVYLGSGGFLAMLLALVSFILAVMSMKEENSYRIFPVAAILLGTVALAGWIGIYLLGLAGA